MQSLNVVVASRDTRTASQLASSLHGKFGSVAVTHSVEEMRHAIPKHRAQLAIIDLELATLDDVERLSHEFNHTSIVCTHRIPDEEMWAAALAAGAIDCCQNFDVSGIVDAVSRNVRMARSNAA